MTNPLVSVIIPIYNSANHLRETVQSVLNQTWKNIEIIMVDDGSTDDSYAIANTLVNTQIKLFRQTNKGASAARNLGLNNAQGDYIQYLDADDLLSPAKIETQINALAGQTNVLALCPTVYFFNGENPYEKEPVARELAYLYSTTDTFAFLLNLYGVNGNGSMVTIHSWLTPKTLIEKAGPWNEAISVDDDGEYFCRIVLSANGIVFTDHIYNYYRKYKNGTNLASKRSLQAMESTFNALALKEQYLMTKKIEPKVQLTFALAYFKLAVDCYPTYKALSKKILKKAKLHLQKQPKLYVGSKVADFVANTISWKLARHIQSLKAKF
jgi:glycosyltransferase involved in cell wall biosynthesis